MTDNKLSWFAAGACAATSLSAAVSGDWGAFVYFMGLAGLTLFLAFN